jgi:hypothetical protein
MTSVVQAYAPPPKGKMSVAPVQWLPGALSSMLPFFAIKDTTPGVLYLRADDPNLCGIYTTGLMNSPVVKKNDTIVNANKGYNFYSAPWCIQTLPCRDLGRRYEITSIDSSVTEYITALYALIGTTDIALTDWKFEQPGYVKGYQVLEGSRYTTVNGTTYFGAASMPYIQVSGVSALTKVNEPLITCDFTFNGPTIEAYQLPYNTFYAVDTPIVVSAIDANNPAANRIYFTLLNAVTLYNNPNYNG